MKISPLIQINTVNSYITFYLDRYWCCKLANTSIDIFSRNFTGEISTEIFPEIFVIMILGENDLYPIEPPLCPTPGLCDAVAANVLSVAVNHVIISSICLSSV